MRTIDYSLVSAKNGGKVTGFNYHRSLNELVGNWSATVAGGSFTAGSSISFDGVMANGVISHAWKDTEKLWHIEGKDAGVRLMRTTPQASLLPEGNAKAVISDLASFCGVSLAMTGSGLSGFNVRSAVTGSTCAEAILELAMLSGYVAYIDNSGTLVITPPSSAELTFDVILDDSGSDIDLDGYATQVTVVVNRRKDVKKSAGSELETHYKGVTPSGQPTQNTKSGSFSYLDAGGKSVSGTYSVTTLEPFGVVKESSSTITREGITVTTKEEHEYIWKTQTVWRGDQEYRLFAFCDTGYTLTQTVKGTYTTAAGKSLPFTEVTTETMKRDMSVFDAQWVSSDWQGRLDMVDREVILRKTERTGGQEPAENMPSYSPPFDSQITREYERDFVSNGLLCLENETRYEARQVGTISPVTYNGEPVVYALRSLMAIQSHSTPSWVSVETYRTYYEQYDNDGNCILSAKSEWSDDGAKWLTANALSSTGDETADTYQEDYAKFTQATKGLDVSLGGGSISTGIWQFVEQAGRVKTITAKEDDESTYALNTAEWYNNGQYVQSVICPHYDVTQKTCAIFGIAAVGDFQGSVCPYKGRGWRSCVRARAALEEARAEYDTALLEAPVVGVKARGETSSTPAAGYQRELYIDDIITEEAAQAIADTAAANILKVKGTKGICRTITIPYNPAYVPNGLITSVSHSWAELQTTVSYLTSGTIPDFMIPTSVAGVASFISDRDAGRRTRPMSGTITAITDEGVIIVKIGGITYPCDSKLVNLGVGDAVLVSFVAGSSLRGQVIERL